VKEVISQPQFSPCLDAGTIATSGSQHTGTTSAALAAVTFHSPKPTILPLPFWDWASGCLPK